MSQNKIYFLSKIQSKTCVRFFQYQLLNSIELRIFFIHFYYDFLNQNYFLFYKVLNIFLKKDRLFSNVDFFGFYNYFIFFILEPEWESFFYSGSYGGRAKKNYSNFFIDFKNLRLFERNFFVCSNEILNLLSVYHYRLIICILDNFFILRKILFYWFYFINRKKNATFDQIFPIFNVLPENNFYSLIFNVLFYNFDLILLKNKKIYFSFRYLNKYFFFKKTLIGLNNLILKFKNFLFYSFRFVSNIIGYVSNLNSGFIFMGFNILILNKHKILKVYPSKYVLSFFLNFSRSLIRFNSNVSA
jgi:hypothetical protein